MDWKKLKFGLLGAVFLFGGCTASDHTRYLDSSADTLFQLKPDQNRTALERQSDTDAYLKLLLNRPLTRGNRYGSAQLGFVGE